MVTTRVITWEEIYALIENLPPGPVYGVPRGGAVIAGMTGHAVDNPNAAHYIVDDIIDSGRTMRQWKKLYPDKPFIALFTKRDHNEWLVFPWEGQDPNDDYKNLATRLLQHGGRPQTPERVEEVAAHLRCYVERQLV